MNASTSESHSLGRWLRLGATLALTVVLVAWIASAIDVDVFMAALRSVAGWRMVWVATVASVVLLLRGLRAGLLLPRDTPRRVVLSAVAIGFVASVVTPLRMGVLVRPWIMARRAGVPFGTGVAGIVAERLLDVVALLVLLAGVGMLALPAGATDSTLSLEAAGMVLGVGALGALGVIGASAWVGPGRAAAWGARLGDAGLRGRVAALGIAFATGARAVAADPARTLAAAGVTLVMWLMGGTSAAIMLSGFDAIPATPALFSTFFAAVMAANAAVPTPGSMGAYEAAGMAALALFGVDGSTAVAAAVAVHMMSLLGQGVVGLAFLLRDGASR